ncbi:hypothetical protein L2750_09490 [Shewanella submarina]|uniref:Uncharacterized protein n=1 Tax=Shewanella submarina TaxID=2016376 RepID=A0ABV7G6U2_9GAMM|nr:hypothetical protein [Shewanella submarina]MCL1037387.1 hypothetical protein [Shewanella submarina]
MKPILVFTLAFFSTQVESHEIKDIRWPDSSVFFNHSERSAEYSLPIGKIVLQEEDSELRTAGYHPVDSLWLEGALNRKVFDFPKQDSPNHVEKMIKTQLARHSYSIQFECKALQCGDIAGWKKWVAPHIAGTEESQRVIVASRLFDNSNANYVLVHISDIESEPRMLLDFIATQPDTPAVKEAE